MIANLAMILTGLWLAYHAIFSTPAGDTGLIGPTAAGVAVILLAAWARRTDVMGWPSGTNTALSLIIYGRATDRRGRPARNVLVAAAAGCHHGRHCGLVVDPVPA